MLQTQILNSKGEPIVLNERETRVARFCESQIKNSLGFEIPITTLTAINKLITEQKLYKIRPSDFLPVRVGDGAWSSEILTFTSFRIGGDFEEGILNQGGNNARLENMDAGVESVKVPVFNWGKEVTYNVMELQQAALSGNWDLVTAKETSRFENWSLGIQRTAFLGLNGNASVKGLLTQADVTANTALITKAISTMTESEFNTLVQGILKAYQANCAYTAMPTHLVMPQDDFNGLAAPVSETFPNKTKYQYLLEAFQLITQNPSFEIKGVAYANQAQNADVSGLNKNRYALYNYDPTSLRMDIPLDYTNTLQNTINGFTFSNVGYGQFTGAKAYRPKEMIYFDWAA